MRVADRDIKGLIQKVNEIHTKTRVIEEKCKSMDKHLEIQNNRLNKHAADIGDIKITQENLKVRMYLVLFIGAGLGGTIGSVITKFVLGGI